MTAHHHRALPRELHPRAVQVHRLVRLHDLPRPAPFIPPHQVHRAEALDRRPAHRGDEGRQRGEAARGALVVGAGGVAQHLGHAGAGAPELEPAFVAADRLARHGDGLAAGELGVGRAVDGRRRRPSGGPTGRFRDLRRGPCGSGYVGSGHAPIISRAGRSGNAIPLIRSGGRRRPAGRAPIPSKRSGAGRQCSGPAGGGQGLPVGDSFVSGRPPRHRRPVGFGAGRRLPRRGRGLQASRPSAPPRRGGPAAPGKDGSAVQADGAKVSSSARSWASRDSAPKQQSATRARDGCSASPSATARTAIRTARRAGKP